VPLAATDRLDELYAVQRLVQAEVDRLQQEHDSLPEAPGHLRRYILNVQIEALQEEIKTLRKEREDDKAEREKNEKLASIQRTIDEGNAQLVREGWQPEGIKLLTEWREKKGIIDPLDAAPAFERQHGPQVTPATPSSHIGGWDFTAPATQDEDYTKKLLETRGESESLVMQQATKSLNEFRGNNRR